MRGGVSVETCRAVRGAGGGGGWVGGGVAGEPQTVPSQGEDGATVRDGWERGWRVGGEGGGGGSHVGGQGRWLARSLSGHRSRRSAESLDSGGARNGSRWSSKSLAASALRVQ